MKIIALAVALSFAYAFASAETGTAKIAGTAAGAAIAGTASFEDTPGGLKIAVVVHGLTPASHGFHIHEYGSCEDSAKAAGGHYNPAHAAHGQALKVGPKKAHAGDTGNIVADEKGDATLDIVLPNVALTGGKYSVAGRTVVIHEKADDFSQPAGNAGGRVACGVIGLTAPAARQAPPPAK